MYLSYVLNDRKFIDYVLANLRINLMLSFITLECSHRITIGSIGIYFNVNTKRQ